jgi:hypothetical protein
MYQPVSIRDTIRLVYVLLSFHVLIPGSSDIVILLRKDPEWDVQIETRVVEAKASVERTDLLNLLCGEIEVSHLKVLLQPVHVVALRDDGNVTLSGLLKPQQELQLT